MEVLNYTVKINPAAEGGFWAEVPALPGCFTQAETLEEVTHMIREAIQCHLEAFVRRGEKFPVEKRTGKSFAVPISVRVPRLA